MHLPAAVAASLSGSSGGLSSMQSCRPSAFADSESPICRGCGQQLLLPRQRQPQPQRRGRRTITALARRAPQPGRRLSAVAAAAAAESGGLPSISAIRHQTKVKDCASLQRIRGRGRLFWMQRAECSAITTSRSCHLLLRCLSTPALKRKFAMLRPSGRPHRWHF